MQLTRRSLIAGTLVISTTRAFADSPSAASAIRYQSAMISIGENMPAIKEDETYYALLASLHLRTSRREVEHQLKLSSAQMQTRLDALVQEGLARTDGRGSFWPTAPVITLVDAHRYFRADPTMVRRTVDAITLNVSELQRHFADLPGFAHISFEAVTLLLLSDVLLDNWQIDRVETGFLKAPRPQRAGGRYYYVVFEQVVGDPVEPLGIYGNHSQDAGGIGINLYGNQRYNGPSNLITLSGEDFVRDFDFPVGTKGSVARAELAQNLVGLWRNSDRAVSPKRLEGLRKLGLVDEQGRTAVPVLSKTDDAGLSGMAAAFAPSLLAILEQSRPTLVSQYQASPYAPEGVGFAEFFIWWYHIFYTAVTNDLVARGQIRMPPRGVVTYLSLD